MKFLLTNDDGVDAPGLAALSLAIAEAAPLDALTVVAPADHCSGCGHQVTTHRPLRLTRRQPGWYALDGMPVDCTRIGVTHVAPDAEWVLSGINQGGNLGADVYVSGTVAAAREAALLGRQAIAISHYVRRGMELDWQTAARWTARVLLELTARPLSPGRFWNVNLPHLPPGSPEPAIVYCPLDDHPLPVEFRHEAGEGDELLFHYAGVYHDRRRRTAHDVEVCFGGQIAVSEISGHWSAST